MEFVWLLIGFVIGLLVAWYFLGVRHSQQLVKRETELKQEIQGAKEDLERQREAHETTKQRLLVAEAKETSAVERADSLEGGLKARSDELERLREAHETTKQRLSEVEGKATSASQRTETLEAELKADREELKRLKTTEEDKRSKINQQQSTIDDLKARLRTTENIRAQLDQQLKAIQEKRRVADDNSRSQIADLEARVRERGEKIAGLEAELAARPATATSPTSVPSAELRGESVFLHSAATPASRAPMDDLTRIKGIGSTLKEKLYGLDITSFQQIADFTPADIARVNEVLDFPGRIEREQWVEQAKAIVQR